MGTISAAELRWGLKHNVIGEEMESRREKTVFKLQKRPHTFPHSWWTQLPAIFFSSYIQHGRCRSSATSSPSAHCHNLCPTADPVGAESLNPTISSRSRAPSGCTLQLHHSQHALRRSISKLFQSEVRCGDTRRVWTSGLRWGRPLLETTEPNKAEPSRGTRVS